MKSTPGWATRRAPTSSPIPGTKFTTPGGTPASIRMSISAAAITVVCSAGFMMTAFPATRGAAVMPQRIASGKFQGAIATPTPRGVQTWVSLSPGTSWVGRGRSSARISAA